MTQDISRNVVAILLVLTIVVASFGTWMILTAQPTTADADTPAGGEIGLTIQSPPEGDVALTIMPSEEEEQEQ